MLYDNLQNKRLNILLVENDLELRLVFSEILRTFGHDVADAADGKYALDIYHASQNTFDLVISDITMPVISGIELGTRISNDDPDLPIIYVTGLNNGDNIEQASKIATAIYAKPVDLEAFIPSLQQYKRI